MMKKKVLILLLLAFIIFPLKVNAKTVADFEAEVEKYTAELREKQAHIAKNDAEVKQVEANIKKIEGQITSAENEIKRLTQEINKNNNEIAKKLEESKAIMAYYQIENGDNAYLEYAFGAETITDMIYRLSITEQLTDYNDKIMKELKELIKKNEQDKKTQAAKKEELNVLQSNLEKEKSRIEADTQGVVASLPSTQALIKSAEDSVKYYKNLGCGKTEDISSCQFRIMQSRKGTSLPSVGAFQRPIENGYVTQPYKGSRHKGIDLSSSNKTIPIHPIAEGEVAAKYEDACIKDGKKASWCPYKCNGNAKIIVIRHNNNGRYIYSMYVHMSNYGSYDVGSYVTKDSVIGYMGTSGCSTGNHLHLEIAYCHYNVAGACLPNTYNNNLINPASLIRFPSSWSNY